MIEERKAREPMIRPGEPTTAAPGSPRKIRVLMERASRREPLFHPLDGNSLRRSGFSSSKMFAGMGFSSSEEDLLEQAKGVDTEDSEELSAETEESSDTADLVEAFEDSLD